jgi:lipooligosaccharide transport system permease protein
MRMFSWHFIRLWQRNCTVFFKLWHVEAPGFIVEPILILLAVGFGLGAYVGMVDGQKYIEFVVPGIIGGYAMFSATFECTYASYFRMEYQRTFDAVLSTPLSVEDVIAGEIFWGATRAFFTGTAMLIIASAFQIVHSPWALLVPLIAFLAGLLFSSIALFFTSLVPYIYSYNYYFSLFITPMFYFSGVFFPLSQFPQIVQSLSWVAPLTPVVYVLRSAMTGNFSQTTLLALALMIVIICIFFSVTLVTMRRRLTR